MGSDNNKKFQNQTTSYPKRSYSEGLKVSSRGTPWGIFNPRPDSDEYFLRIVFFFPERVAQTIKHSAYLHFAPISLVKFHNLLYERLPMNPKGCVETIDFQTFPKASLYQKGFVWLLFSPMCSSSPPN